MSSKARKRKQPPAPPASSDSEAENSIDDLVAALGSEDEDEGEAEVEEGSEAPAESPEEAGEDGDDAEASPVSLVEDLPIDAEDDLRNVEGEASPRLMSIVESILLAADKPMTVKQFRRLLREPTANQIRLALKQLIADTSERGVVVVQVAGGFVMRTNPRNARWVQKFLQARPVRLSRAQLETLALVAYRQPVTRAEIEHVRGVDSGAVLTGLLERDLVRIAGRKEEPGRPMLYGTTVKFLELFNLMSLKDLPDLQEFKELSDATKDHLRKKMEDEEIEALGQEVMEFAEGKDEDEDEAEAEAVEESPDEASGEAPEDSESDAENAQPDEAGAEDDESAD
jgi:segregation and condensation protein B